MRDKTPGNRLPERKTQSSVSHNRVEKGEYIHSRDAREKARQRRSQVRKIGSRAGAPARTGSRSRDDDDDDDPAKDIYRRLLLQPGQTSIPPFPRFRSLSLPPSLFLRIYNRLPNALTDEGMRICAMLRKKRERGSRLSREGRKATIFLVRRKSLRECETRDIMAFNQIFEIIYGEEEDEVGY